MNTYRMRLATVSTLAGLALLGAGCFGTEPTPPSAEPSTPPSPTPAAPVTPPTTTPTSPTSTPPATSTTPSGIELPAIDATWMTYTNRAQTFSFQYPTKGRYAPTWEVLMPAKLENGCYVNAEAGSERAPQTSVTVGSLMFCHTSYMDAGAGQRYLTDYYATTMSGQNVVIAFSKHLSNGDNVGPACAGKLVLPGATERNCLEVDLATYVAHLDQIVGTFQSP